jgi:hypothetical protein
MLFLMRRRWRWRRRRRRRRRTGRIRICEGTLALVRVQPCCLFFVGFFFSFFLVLLYILSLFYFSVLEHHGSW